MTIRNLHEAFQVVVSTKKTLFGASAEDFRIFYAPISDLANRTAVSGGLSEIVLPIEQGSEHTATTTAAASYGARMLRIDAENSTIQEGDTIEYAQGKYGYVMRIVGDKLYLKRPIRADVPSGATIKQVGNTGEYVTPQISIDATGEYILAIEAPDYGLLVEERIKIVDPDAGQSVDPDAPEEAVAVAY